jgi:hypothetical protein
MHHIWTSYLEGNSGTIGKGQKSWFWRTTRKGVMSMRGSIYFNEGYDVDGVEEIVEQFKEADLWYREKEVRFIGTAERFQELVRAIKTVEEPKKVVP